MMEWQDKRTHDVTVDVLAIPEDAGLPVEQTGYVIARLSSDMRSSFAKQGDLVLCASRGEGYTDLQLEPEEVLPLPRGIEPEIGLYAVPVALSLWVWESLHLELGEVAACTGAHWLDRILPQVAIWRGARTVVTVGDDTAGLTANGVTPLDVKKDPAALVKQLSAVMEAAPGAAAVELSGRAETVDVLFESLPQGSRLMLAGESAELLTIDYYNNVHRKGVVIKSSVLTPNLLFSNSSPTGPANYMRRACTILGHEELGPVCRRLLSGR